MKRLVRIAMIVLPLFALAVVTAHAEVKTRDKTSVKFEGMLGRMFNLFGGKAAKEGIEASTAVKGDRKASINDATGHIIDLSEEKVYDLDMRKKTYTVTTFDELRRRMREAEDKARQQAQKEEPAQPQQPANTPTKEYEVDFDVKETGQKKSIAGYDTHEAIVTITVRQKGMTLEDGGGVVMTNDTWLGPQLPQLKELVDFDIRYWRQLQGADTPGVSPEQMAMVLASFPMVKNAMDRMQKDGDKLKGTPLDTTSTFESVKSKDQLAQEQANGSSSAPSGGGIGGMLAKKMMKKDAPTARATIMTTHHEILEVASSVSASDLAIPPDFKEKK
jgi:hypothetical protein